MSQGLRHIAGLSQGVDSGCVRKIWHFPVGFFDNLLINKHLSQVLPAAHHSWSAANKWLKMSQGCDKVSL